MAEQPTITDIVTAYLPEASDTERAELASELKALAAAFYHDFRAGRRFDESATGMVDLDSPPTGP